tara:strand:- start:72 stop:353 length:282 start_codon:yes stop_codon:yes gene_type:complete
MNDLKTAERSRLAEKLSSLMMWHVEGRAMACSEVPVMDILQEFRVLAGIRGRNAHRGQQPPKYDHTVKVEEAEVNSGLAAPLRGEGGRHPTTP